MTTENPQAPPSSAEEAAALLGAAISFGDASNNESSAHPNPPVGMHSIFAVQSPVPNSVLFVRLCNLREWLRWHSDEDDGSDIVDDPLKQALEVSFPKRDKSPKEPFIAARSILAVLMKLLEVTSSISDTNEDNKPLAGIGSPKTKHNKPIKQHKPLPPLLSTPLRAVWVHCVALCISLGSSLPGNQRTDVYAFITKMMDIVNMNPRSKLASGGVRHAALEVIQRICTLNTEMAKRSTPYAGEILQCCHRGLMSGGTGEPGHRAQCVRMACGLMIGCRRASKSGGDETFVVSGALEERAAVEAIKFLKRAASDKYPEVRMAAATFAGLTAPLLVRYPSVMRKEGEGVSPLAWLEDVTQLAMRNLDDESAGVATAWAQSLARCLCASAEYGKSVREAQSEDQANKRSADVDDEDIAVDKNNLDFAGKFKAFSESRRAAAATSVCSSVLAAVKFLVSHFVKVGGEGANNKCGGSFSIGGRASRIGYSTTLTEFLRLQSAKGEFNLTEALLPVLDMVGVSFEKQVERSEHKKTPSIVDSDLYAPSSPYSSPEKRAQSSISTAFLSKASKASSSDSSIGRLLASIVLRRGISENMPELSQFSVLKDLTTACRLSVVPVAVDGSFESSRHTNFDHGKVFNRHQLQVALVEMSHLIITLGEAAAAILEEITPVLKDCLAHREHGVRLEAATVYVALSQAFPTEGRKFVIESLSVFSANIDTIESLASRTAAGPISTPKGRFRKGSQDNNTAGSRLADDLIQHQCHMHGNALTVSMLMHQFPHVLGGIPRVIVDKTFDVCEKLLMCQTNEAFAKANPSAVCTCVRAGYCMLSGIFTMGVDAVINHVTIIFGLWQAASMNVLPGVSNQCPTHDLLCIESMLMSVVSFLKYCPTLLLSVPDALSRVTALLEKIFPPVSSGGRFEREEDTSLGNARLSNARSAIMEAYSWLPPGSFPMSADRIFAFSAKQIQELSGNEVTCNVLGSLLSREDDLLDAHSFQRSVNSGQAGQCSVVDIVVTIRSSDIVTSYEREATINLVSWRKTDNRSNHHHGSSILGSFLHEKNNKPTPLHEVGTWREPLDPIPSVKVRLLDSSIHVFAATFGLQDPHTQSDALRMLESMYISTQTEKSNRFNVNAALITDSQGKVQPLEEDAITFNVTAVILACLQAIPLHEATYGNLIGKGPPWMERATSILLQLISSPSDSIRRGAAEGLSFLATLGVTEDANTLQSTILHALDEVMKGSNITPAQKTSSELTSSGRAGSLLSLACIQRTSKSMEQRKIDRATSRSVAQTPDSKEQDENAPPVLIMMTRLLPSLATHSPESDSYIVRAHAIHSFGVLVANCFPKPGVALSPEQSQIARKAIESVETSFLAAWSAVMFDYDKGREREKFASEPALVAALIRLMTTLLPWLSELIDIDRWVASRFSNYASAMVECLNHPVVLFEAAVFFESLSVLPSLVHANNCCVVRTDITSAEAMPLFMSVIQPDCTSIISENTEYKDCAVPILRRAVVMCLSRMCSSEQSVGFSFNIRSALFLFLHDICGRRRFQHISDLRSVAQSNTLCRQLNDLHSTESEVVTLINSILERRLKYLPDESKPFYLLGWLLFGRCVISGVSGKTQHDGMDAAVTPIQKTAMFYRTAAEAEASFASSNHPRWQLKSVAANVACRAMELLLSIDDKHSSDKSIFNLSWAKSKLSETSSDGDRIAIPSSAVFVEELVLCACSAAASTSNHSELISVQTAGTRLLSELIKAFGDMVDTTANDGSSLLNQYSSQIISAVKHALKSELSEDAVASGYHLLFSAGCDALLALIKNSFINDSVALKRLLKPTMLSKDEAVPVKFPSNESTEISALVTSPHCVTDDLRSYPSFRLAKLCFIAKASMLVAYEEINQLTSAVITKEFESDEEGRAIHMSAFAIDGFILLKGSKNSSGLTYAHRADLDPAVIEGLVENWAVLCSSAISSLIKLIRTNDASENVNILKDWLEKVLAVAFAGLTASLITSSHVSDQTAENAQACIYAIRLVIRESTSIDTNILQPSEVSSVIDLVTKSVIHPTLESSQNVAHGNKRHLLKQACWLLEDTCQNFLVLSSSSVLKQSILDPMSSIQENKIALEQDNDFIISSCIRSSTFLLRSCAEGERDQLEKALSQFALATLIKLRPTQHKFCTQSECIGLLHACTEKSVLSQDDWRQIIAFTAANEVWDAWSSLSSTLPPGVGIECSIHLFKKSLGDLNTSPSRHTNALVALRNGLQVVVSSNPNAVGTVLAALGFEVFQLFKYHSTDMHTESTPADECLILCAECIKIIMMAYQYLTAAAVGESKFVAFLVSLFTLFVDTITFNGLPNSPSGKAGADEKIGKMCAQVLSHIVRTTPLMFKSTMSFVAPECRSTIEAAVRADMSGYASASQGPARKKLNLKGFVR